MDVVNTATGSKRKWFPLQPSIKTPSFIRLCVKFVAITQSGYMLEAFKYLCGILLKVPLNLQMWAKRVIQQGIDLRIHPGCDYESLLSLAKENHLLIQLLSKPGILLSQTCHCPHLTDTDITDR